MRLLTLNVSARGHYTLFTLKQTSKGTRNEKVIPRYPQVEATEAILTRVKDPTRNQGLVWQHQGSGKTLTALGEADQTCWAKLTTP